MISTISKNNIPDHFSKEENKVCVYFEEKMYYKALDTLSKLISDNKDLSDKFLDYISSQVAYFKGFDVSSTSALNLSIHNFMSSNELNKDSEEGYDVAKTVIDSVNRFKSSTHATIILDLKDIDLISYYNKSIINLRSTNDFSILINLLQRLLEIKDKIRSRTVYGLINKFLDKDIFTEQEGLLKNYFEDSLKPSYDSMIESGDYMNSGRALEVNKKLLYLFENDYTEAVKLYFEEPHKDISTHVLFLKNSNTEDLTKAYHRLFYQYITGSTIESKEFYKVMTIKFLDLLGRDEEFFINFGTSILKTYKKAGDLGIEYNKKLESFLDNKDCFNDKSYKFFNDSTIDFIELKLRISLTKIEKEKIIDLSNKYNEETDEGKDAGIFNIEHQSYEHTLKSEILEYLFEIDSNKALDFFKRSPGKTKLMILIYILNANRDEIIDSSSLILDYFFKDKGVIKEFGNRSRGFNLLRDQEIFNILKEKISGEEYLLDIFQLQLERHRDTVIEGRKILDYSKAIRGLSQYTVLNLGDYTPKRGANKVFSLLNKGNPEDALLIANKLFEN